MQELFSDPDYSEGTAPAVVSDMNNDGVLNNKDLVLMGHKPLTKGKKVDFVVNGL